MNPRHKPANLSGIYHSGNQISTPLYRQRFSIINKPHYPLGI
ncbi:hypothetical protein ymoll0001_11630 [Yersinia mollaretii ATCC 43969]|uniref:Uncharacterized protein n=1 Tax=Yersinia mollaretii (strain ATCC 43969 / DSM 18520 / CIP 103324 / CNY 7263 / WAIP 204) TaxID=349967 RepID=A0ABP2EJI6_YERMW|nr:hypothetical protein ymoll0001_11630 [Yersinia mollaretii ATCC 43969]